MVKTHGFLAACQPTCPMVPSKLDPMFSSLSTGQHFQGFPRSLALPNTKIIPKSQNHPKSIPKASQKHPKIHILFGLNFPKTFRFSPRPRGQDLGAFAQAAPHLYHLIRGSHHMTRQTPDGRDSLSVFCPQKNDLYQKIGDITTKSINLLVFSFSHPPIRPSCSPPCCTPPPRASRPQLPARSRAAARPPDMAMVLG